MLVIREKALLRVQYQLVLTKTSKTMELIFAYIRKQGVLEKFTSYLDYCYLKIGI